MTTFTEPGQQLGIGLGIPVGVLTGGYAYGDIGNFTSVTFSGTYQAVEWYDNSTGEYEGAPVGTSFSVKYWLECIPTTNIPTP
jgi:hypothetical protein